MKKLFAAIFAKSQPVGAMDVVLAACVVTLAGFGVVMVYSAGVVEAAADFGNAHHFLQRHAAFAVAGLLVLYVTSRFDYHKLRPLTYFILGGVTLLMLLSVIGFGHTGGGAARWLKLGPINVQPSEAAKVALVFWLAYSLDRKRERVKSFSIGMLPHLIMAGGLVLLCMKQPDFGSAAVLLFLTFAMLFVAGARIGYLLGAVMLGAGFAVSAVRFSAYRWERIQAWIDMEQHRQDLAYQPFQAAMSFGSGEVTGVGLGKGLQVLYLPESHTDFISAIIGEELGFLGIMCMLAVYCLIVVRGVKIAFTAEDEYGSYIAFGLSVLFGVQTLVNLCVAMSVLPTKGLTLPFVSYGGSSLMVSAAAMGVLLNISRPRLTESARTVDLSPAPEASAMIFSEASFGSDEAPAEGRLQENPS